MLSERPAGVNILLDLDGTLTDPSVGILACIRHALAALDAPSPPDSELVRLIGPPLRDTFAELLGGDASRAETAVRLYRERFSAVGMFENAVYDGIPQTLESLANRGARLYLATSKPRVFAEKILDHFGLARHFTAIFGSELSGELSDKAELIAHALSTARLDPSGSVMVGDRKHDVRGAKLNEVLPVGVLWGFGSREELRSAGAEQLLETPAELGSLAPGR